MQSHYDRSNADIARNWIAYYARTARPNSATEIKAHDKDPGWWAVNALMELDSHDPARALEITFLIAIGSEDGWVLENLGAGPLENLIDGDPTLLDAIALEAVTNPRLKVALQSVWQREMSEDAWARLQRIAGL